MLFVFFSIPDKYKTQETCSLAVSLYFPFIVYCLYKYITQEMCDEIVNDSLAALKLIRDWFVTSKMIKRLFTAVYADENILYFNQDSGDAKLLRARRWEKNTIDFYWILLLMYTI